MGAIHLVRHGQASFGTGDYDRLSELGHEQARLAGQDMAARGLRPDVVIHGGMRRQRETAEGLLAGAGWDCPVEVDPRWAEYDADAVLDAPSVSRMHVRFSRNARGELVMKDLNSTNGTFRNGLALKPEEEVRIERGDVIRIGALEFFCR